jgi:hypothetical protein
MSAQSIVGLVLILIGAILCLIGFFVISPVHNFLTAVLVASAGFLLIAIGGGILRTRMGMWARK